MSLFLKISLFLPIVLASGFLTGYHSFLDTNSKFLMISWKDFNFKVTFEKIINLFQVKESLNINKGSAESRKYYYIDIYKTFNENERDYLLSIVDKNGSFSNSVNIDWSKINSIFKKVKPKLI